MSFKSDNSIDLIKELSATHEIIGYAKTKQAIISARSDENLQEKLFDQLVKYIKTACCREFRISQDKCFNKKVKNPQRINAITIMCLVAKKQMDFSLTENGRAFNIHSTRVSKLITAYNQYRGTLKHEQLMIQKYEKLNEATEVQREKLKKEIYK